jgi:hypothetical protein
MSVHTVSSPSTDPFMKHVDEENEDDDEDHLIDPEIGCVSEGSSLLSNNQTQHGTNRHSGEDIPATAFIPISGSASPISIKQESDYVLSSPIKYRCSILRKYCCHFLFIIIFISFILFISFIIILITVDIPILSKYRLNPPLEFKLWRLSLTDAFNQCAFNTHQSSIIVSLSTLPYRLPYLHRILKSLLTQTVCPKEIHIWIPKENKRLNGQVYQIPTDLLYIIDQQPIPQRVFLHRIDNDYGPATKLLPTLLEASNLHLESDQRILVCDDDIIYSPLMIEQYDCFAPLIGSNAALGMHGKTLLSTWDSHIIPSLRPGELKRIHEADMMLGTSSFVVQPKFFPKDLSSILNYTILDPFIPDSTSADSKLVSNERNELHESAYFEDDWYWAFLLEIMDVPRIIIPIDRSQSEQSDTLIFIGRGSLTSTDNSADADPISKGRRHANIVANAYRKMAISHSDGFIIPIPKPNGIDADVPISSLPELIHAQCSLEPEDMWKRCDSHWISRWLCKPIDSLLMKIGL